MADSTPPTWQDLVHKYGPWLLALVVSLAMHYLDPSPSPAPFVPPPLPTVSLPPDHTATSTTDSTGKVKTVVLPNPK